MRPLATLAASTVRAVIAQSWLGGGDAPVRVGAITLLPHQRVAVARLRRILAERGTALLADDVGLGKTYVAAAIAATAGHALVVAPAALRAMWRHALQTATVAATVASYEALSREGSGGTPLAAAPDLLILDEAHHARTPTTRRYRRLAELAVGARVLLLTATPIHNRRDDVCSLLALALGHQAYSLDDTAIAALTVRRAHEDVRDVVRLPDRAAHRWLDVGDDEWTVRALTALPPPLPPRGGSTAGALLTWTLVRQWASSRGALAGALRRRLARAAAIGASLERGCYPSPAELTAWRCDEAAVQLAFPELLTGDPTDAAAADIPALLDAVRTHEVAVRALLRELAHAPDIDLARATRLRELRAAHPDERIVAFTQYADTARALYRELRADAGVGVLTAHGGLVAGGALSRREVLRRFAPSGVGAAPPNPVERIQLLLTTDLLSEGLNLQDASVVVHLDLPWTPARIEQRVGRSRRLGARHERTAVYALAPPASADTLLGLERRLREKVAAATHVFGVVGAILPTLAPAEPVEAEGPLRAAELLHLELERWAAEQGPTTAGADPGIDPGIDPGMDAGIGPGIDAGILRSPTAPVLVAAVRAPLDGALVLLVERAPTNRGRCALVAILGGQVSAAPDAVLEAVRAATAIVPSLTEARGPAPDAERVERALGLVARWLAHRRADLHSGLALPPPSDARRQALRRIGAITARAPQHRRALLAPLAAQARRVATARLGVAAEHILAELVAAPMADDAWLRALNAFGSVHANGPDSAPDADPSEAAAVLLLQR